LDGIEVPQRHSEVRFRDQRDDKSPEITVEPLLEPYVASLRQIAGFRRQYGEFLQMRIPLIGSDAAPALDLRAIRGRSISLLQPGPNTTITDWPQQGDR
jgi:hypothetical protein